MWSAASAARDNWERLAAAVIKREEIWQLCHQDSRSPSISTISSHDDISQRILSFSSMNLEPFSVPPSPLRPPNIPLIVSQVSNNAPSGRKLLTGWIPIRKSKNDDIPAPELYGGLIRYPLRELQAATDNFSNKNVLGRGGFGKVYKGRLADSTLVAIKRLREGPTQWERLADGTVVDIKWLREEPTQWRELQFQTEVEIISRMGGHRNLCRLRGFCITSKERILIFPYMSNGSLASCLRERPESEPPLSWATRKTIALGVAKGLAYLHEGISGIKIIHRDIKAANILLGNDSEAVIGDFGLAITAEDAAAQNILGDEEFETVVGDFSLAKVMDCGDTHVTSAVRGTIGHIAPEYLSTGKVSDKNDVFSYGVTLLELITGQRAFDLARLANDDDVMLLDWVKGLLKEMKLEVLVDGDLQSDYEETEVEGLMQVALLCTQSSPVDRPKMSEVLRLLEGDGLSERWAEWQNMEVLQQEGKYPTSKWIIEDSIEDLNAEELSGPR